MTSIFHYLHHENEEVVKFTKMLQEFETLGRMGNSLFLEDEENPGPDNQAVLKFELLKMFEERGVNHEESV